MPRVVLLIVVILSAAVVAVAILIRRAPEGREGKGGFTYGTGEKPDGSLPPAAEPENAPATPPPAATPRVMKQ